MGGRGTEHKGIFYVEDYVEIRRSAWKQGMEVMVTGTSYDTISSLLVMLACFLARVMGTYVCARRGKILTKAELLTWAVNGDNFMVFLMMSERQ